MWLRFVLIHKHVDTLSYPDILPGPLGGTGTSYCLERQQSISGPSGAMDLMLHFLSFETAIMILHLVPLLQ